MKESRVRLLDYEGSVLSGRMRAKSLIADLAADVADGDHVMLDFEGVLALSPSFADELFVRFAGTLGADRVTFINMSPELERVAAAVTRNQQA